jgi:hypothetical protein
MKEQFAQNADIKAVAVNNVVDIRNEGVSVDIQKVDAMNTMEFVT